MSLVRDGSITIDEAMATVDQGVHGGQGATLSRPTAKAAPARPPPARRASLGPKPPRPPPPVMRGKDGRRPLARAASAPALPAREEVRRASVGQGADGRPARPPIPSRRSSRGLIARVRAAGCGHVAGKGSRSWFAFVLQHTSSPTPASPCPFPQADDAIAEA